MADIKAGRAAQFSPFAALEGYADRISDTAALCGEFSSVTRRNNEELSAVINSLKKWDFIRLTVLSEKGEEEMCGGVTSVDTAYRVLEISGECISFDDILQITKE